MGPSTKLNLRERRRQDLTAEIKDVARRQLATEGLGALSLRAVAREVGMAVSALYRYFASRDDLITALLEDAYTAQAEAVEAAVAGIATPGRRLRAALLEFRAWSVRNRQEYGLMYGTPLPGYVAPPERLYAAGTRVATLLYRSVADAERAGALDPALAARRLTELPTAHLDQLEAWRRRRAPEMSLGAVVVTVDVWTRVQGLLSLEVFGQLRPVLPDSEAYFTATVDQALATAGIVMHEVSPGPGDDPRQARH